MRIHKKIAYNWSVLIKHKGIASNWSVLVNSGKLLQSIHCWNKRIVVRLRLNGIKLFCSPVEDALYGAVDAAVSDEEDGLLVGQEALLGDLAHEQDVRRHLRLAPVGGDTGERGRGSLEYHPLRQLRECPHHGVEEVGRDVDSHGESHGEDDEPIISSLNKRGKILKRRGY